jgi:hypothetical protein
MKHSSTTGVPQLMPLEASSMAANKLQIAMMELGCVGGAWPTSMKCAYQPAQVAKPTKLHTAWHGG